MSDNPLSSENAASIFERAKAILMTPKTEWPKIAAETKGTSDILIKYALPLILIGPVCSLIGSQLFGYGGFGFSFRPSLGFSIQMAITSLVSAIIGLFLISFIANFLSPKFGGKDNFGDAFKLVAYSMTAGWVAGVFGLVPMLGILALLGLYSLYLFYLGATAVMGVPEDKATGFTALTIVAAFVVMIVLAMLSTAIIGGPAGIGAL